MKECIKLSGLFNRANDSTSRGGKQQFGKMSGGVFRVRPLGTLMTRSLSFPAGSGVGCLLVVKRCSGSAFGGTGAICVGLWVLPLLLVASAAQRAESPPRVRSLVISLRRSPAHATWDGRSITGGRLRLGCGESMRRYWPDHHLHHVHHVHHHHHHHHHGYWFNSSFCLGSSHSFHKNTLH